MATRQLTVTLSIEVSIPDHIADHIDDSVLEEAVGNDICFHGDGCIDWTNYIDLGEGEVEECDILAVRAN